MTNLVDFPMAIQLQEAIDQAEELQAKVDELDETLKALSFELYQANNSVAVWHSKAIKAEKERDAAIYKKNSQRRELKRLNKKLDSFYQGHDYRMNVDERRFMESLLTFKLNPTQQDMLMGYANRLKYTTQCHAEINF